ncbi:hypothetical protein DFJ74DRAFT_744564, partial [Hyaloraphidium curvatum]
SGDDNRERSPGAVDASNNSGQASVYPRSNGSASPSAGTSPLENTLPMSKLNPEAPAFVPSSSSAAPEPSTASHAGSPADARRREESMTTNERTLEYVELNSFGQPGGSPLQLLPWSTVERMPGPELTTTYGYWGLETGKKRQRDARYNKLCMDELEWLFTLPDAAAREALDYVAVRGWTGSAQTIAATLGLRGYRSPKTFPVVAGTGGPGLPRVDRKQAVSIETLAGSMAGMQVTPVRNGIVQAKPKPFHHRAAKELLGKIKELAASRKRTLEAFVYLGVPALVGFEIDRRRRIDICEEGALEILGAAAAAGGSVCVVDLVGGCAFHAGSPATAAGIYAFEASDGTLLALSAEDKAKIWKQLDMAYHTRTESL